MRTRSKVLNGWLMDSLSIRLFQRVDCRIIGSTPRPRVYTPTLLDLPRVARTTLCGWTICLPSPPPCNYSKPRAATERERRKEIENAWELMHEPLKNAVERPLFRELFTLSASDATHDDACDRARNESRSPRSSSCQNPKHIKFKIK